MIVFLLFLFGLFLSLVCSSSFNLKILNGSNNLFEDGEIEIYNTDLNQGSIVGGLSGVFPSGIDDISFSLIERKNGRIIKERVMQRYNVYKNYTLSRILFKASFPTDFLKYSPPLDYDISFKVSSGEKYNIILISINSDSSTFFDPSLFKNEFNFEKLIFDFADSTTVEHLDISDLESSDSNLPIGIDTKPKSVKGELCDDPNFDPKAEFHISVPSAHLNRFPIVVWSDRDFHLEKITFSFLLHGNSYKYENGKDIVKINSNYYEMVEHNGKKIPNVLVSDINLQLCVQKGDRSKLWPLFVQDDCSLDSGKLYKWTKVIDLNTAKIAFPHSRFKNMSLAKYKIYRSRLERDQFNDVYMKDYYCGCVNFSGIILS